MTITCCDLHGRNCEPPSELCCEGCTETTHPGHADGSTCSNPDLSSYGSPDYPARINRFIAAELLAWAALLDAGGGIRVLKTVYQDLAVDLRSRAFALSPPNPDDHAEIQARLAELRGPR